jgi:septal ring factor EnvC (AmiA/AmiB activator)
MTLLISLIIAVGAFIIGYIAVKVYTRWRSMTDELRYLREDITMLENRVDSKHKFLKEGLEQEIAKMKLNYDGIWKSIRELEDSIERLKKWQLSINDIFINQEPPEQKEQQTLYHPTKRSATRRRKS